MNSENLTLFLMILQYIYQKLLTSKQAVLVYKYYIFEPKLSKYIVFP